MTEDINNTYTFKIKHFLDYPKKEDNWAYKQIYISAPNERIARKTLVSRGEGEWEVLELISVNGTDKSKSEQG